MKSTDIKIKSPSGKELSYVSEFTHQLSFVIGSHGLFSSGKTRLPVTGPDKTFILPIDSKCRRTVENNMRAMGKEFGKNILMPPVDFIDHLNPMQAERMDENASKEFYRNQIETCKEWLLAAHANKDVKLIAIDTAGELYNWMRFAYYGREGSKFKKLDAGGKSGYKDMTDANQEFRDLIRYLGTKPLLLLHMSKDEYLKGGSKPIGLTFEGFKFMGNACEVSIMHEFNKEFDEEDADKNWRFAITIQSCIDRVELQGPEGRRILLDDSINMGNLMQLVFPDQDWSDWQ